MTTSFSVKSQFTVMRMNVGFKELSYMIALKQRNQAYGSRHFADKDAYRRDGRKDELLQENGCFILRFLADDVMNNLGEVMTRVVRRLK